MPKPHTLPYLYDEALQLKISKLKQWGYLKPGTAMHSTLTWSRNNEPAGSIGIKVNMYGIEKYIDLEYNFREQPRAYRVHLTSVRSNLGKGEVWYFVCPQTMKRCRILYSISGYFLHREAFRGCMYESQTQTKRYRNLEKLFGPYYAGDALYSQLYKKHFKKFYAGKPTKRYLRLMEKIRESDRYTPPEMEMLKMGLKGY